MDFCLQTQMNNSNDWTNQTVDLNASTGDNYYYYNGSGKKAINLTSCKGNNAYCFLETSTSYWEKESARFQVWDGSADVWMTKVGGIKNGNPIYLYTKSASVEENTTFYFKRMSSDGSSKWNEGSAPYHKGGYYTNTGWGNVSYQSGSSLGSIVWPEKPATSNKSFTVNVYDATGAPKVNGTTLSSTISGTNCQWYTYSYSGTTLPASVAIANNGGGITATLSSPENGQTYYYAFNGYSMEAVSSDYDPNRRSLVYWPNGNQYSSATNVAMTTTDGINFTATDVPFYGNDWFVFTTTYTNNWDNDKANFYGNNNGNVTISGTSANGTASKGQTGIYNVTNAGVWTITYNIITNEWTATRSGDLAANSFTVYVLANNAPYLYSFDPEWNGVWPGTEMSGTEQLADGNTWYKKTYETYDNQIKIIFNNGQDGENKKQTADIIQTDPVAYYYYDGATKYRRVPAPTGKMYVIGQVGGNPWAANVGTELTDNGDGTFSLNKVQIIAGATFAFATQLGTNENAWDELKQYRLNSTADGDQWLVTNAMTDKTNPTPLPLQLWAEQDKTFNMEETAYYDITFDSKTWTVTITRDYDALYMYYGSHWAANAGVPMLTTDGVTYTLTGVTLAEGGTFQFTKQLGDDEKTWPADDKRLGAKADGNEWIVTNEQLNIVLENALLAGSTKDFKMDEGTAGTYRVVVNPTAGTLALYKMAEVLGSKVIIHLEQTSNVSKPKLWAYDKERNKENTDYIHVDRPSRKEIATNRRVFFANNTPNEANTITTADGRKWWTWEVNGGAICDFWFTRNDYDYANHLDDELNDNMTDIQWRKSGELFLTWPATGTALDDFTRDYYAAAAQEAADCAVMIEGHKYAYFTNTPGWDNVFCHAWYTDANGVNHDMLTPPKPYEGNPCYPGALCELVGYDKDGYEVWRIDLTAVYNAAGITSESQVGILFNNGIDDNHSYGHQEGENHDYGTGGPTTAAKEQSSDFAYSTGTCYDYCGVIVLGRSLGNIIRNGVVNGPVYTIEEDLVGVYFDPLAETTVMVDNVPVTLYGALYCKDMNNFVTTQYVDKSLQQEGQVDYMREYYAFYGTQYENYFPKRPDRYDQSNWVKLTLSTQYPGYDNVEGNKDAQLALLRDYVGKVLPAESVRGQLVNNFNPEMHLALQALPDAATLADNNYKDSPNVFITSSFVGSQKGVDPYNHEFNMFFVTPKPQEYADITWALYNGNNEFVVCDRATYYLDITGKEYYMNGFNLNGYFKVKWDMNQNGDVSADLVDNKLYQFKGIVRLIDEGTAGGSASAPRRADGSANDGNVKPKPNNVTSSRYIVSPLNLSATDEHNLITGIKDLTGDAAVKQVVSVSYVDVTGKMSNSPFDGVNIVVTRYSDGTTSTSKVVK